MHKPKLVVIDCNYPSPSNLYGDVFVQTRLKYYQNDFDINVIGYQRQIQQKEQYVYEGINVCNTNSIEEATCLIKETGPDVIAIHFVARWMFNFIKETKVPIFIWVHGAEALGWYRRLFNFKLQNLIGFFRGSLGNMRQLFFMHQLIKFSNKTKGTHFIFVSRWMKKITEIDTFSIIESYHLIPNPIDSELFAFKPKIEDSRKSILLIRSFDSKKYANDIAIKAIEILSTKPFFSDMSFTIYGKGVFFRKLTSRIKKFKNVSLQNNFIENTAIPKIHGKHGIFLCPTRQDAQGVSMCEAMSSGLVVISSRNTAIPEFVTDKITGFLTNSPKEIANTIEYLYFNPLVFSLVSKNGSQHIQNLAGHKKIIQEEIDLMQNASLIYQNEKNLNHIWNASRGN